jgi:hypothetical protein
MALFTVLLEFDGGTYIAQLRAPSSKTAVAKYAAQVLKNSEIGRLPARKRLAEALSVEVPIAIEGVRKVWCCSASVGRKFALVNIVQMAE